MCITHTLLNTKVMFMQIYLSIFNAKYVEWLAGHKSKTIAKVFLKPTQSYCFCCLLPKPPD